MAMAMAMKGSSVVTMSYDVKYDSYVGELAKRCDSCIE